MFDSVIQILAGIFDLIQMMANHLPLPLVGVGGGVEAKEHVDLIPLLKFTAIFLTGIGVVFGLGLAYAAKRFSVKVDPRVDQVLDFVAHAHCGACGYAGCRQYAEAVVSDPAVSPSLCSPGGAASAEAIAKITGKEAGEMEPQFARVLCNGGENNSRRRFEYEGVKDCRAAVLVGGGDKACVYGCLGYGTCVASCVFGALSMGENGLPVVDITKCTGCKKCEQACPKRVIEVVPASKTVLVTCRSNDKGGDTKKNCDAGCIGCGICVKICPFDAPSVQKSLSVIDLSRCRVCGLCVAKCPTKAITEFLPLRPKASVLESCIGCQICVKVCPVDAPSGELKKMHLIDKDKCIGCGICTAKCHVQAIDGTFNAREVFAAAAEKKKKKADEAA